MSQYWQLAHRSLWIKRAWLAFQVVLKFFAPLIHDGYRWDRGGIAQRTESTSQHVLSQVFNVVYVLLQTATGVEARQCLFQPICALAAGDTPPAALMLVKLHDAQGKLDHAGVFIKNHHAARAQKFAALRKSVEVHVELLGFFGSEHKSG